MYSIILDSATKNLYCALIDENKIIFEKYITGENDHAKNIVSVIKEALEFANIKPNQLNKFVCGVGPGSYTGERMAVTVAKIFASYTNIELYKISTLALISSGYSGNVLAIIDARRGNVFGAIYNNGIEVFKETHIEKAIILQEKYDYIATEENFIIDPIKAVRYAKFVDNKYLLVPNYLRDTEAERNLIK